MAFPALYKEIPYQDPALIFPVLEQEKHPLFLDSAMADPRLGAVSYIAIDPFIVFEAKEGKCQQNGDTISIDPITYLTDLLDAYKLERLEDEDVPLFQGGAAGLFSYDLGWYLEKLPTHQGDDAKIPELAIGLYDLVIAFDHNQQRSWIISTGQNSDSVEPDVNLAEKRLSYIQGLLSQATDYSWPDQIIPPLTWRTDLSRQDYEDQVQKVVDYIYAGDIFQANLSQQFRAHLPEGFNPLAFYKTLRKVNAATFAGYFKTDDMVIASSSPERFIKVQDGQAETRPIKGTRPRFDDPEQDRASAADLLAAEKDRSENVMIVDLLRNDLSKNCAPHTVTVPELCALESYASVHHLVSSVTGRLKSNRSSFDLLSEAFPGGSITGAPKLRSMEIIAELEPWRRGAYCGSLGFISFAGDMDTSILIRTVTIKDGTARFNVGGGIVADSTPASEYEETLVKARGIFDTFDAMSSGQSVILSGRNEEKTSKVAS
ncbi:aminodeoxychorismate synthase component I [Curvivirga aplysinae]|uniref:aminodeoxychorismate synthase component I n=1 Tax=Curvivirga aplysinae TaxID=2529852 RepID=UPI0012BBB9B9|nr:aminodeoxychorismate synthase component I [Curvivirga aplysinae]MTI11106.1 aminodeoxychorismate synthase component I [Curvivirga aplysinae]